MDAGLLERMRKARGTIRTVSLPGGGPPVRLVGASSARISLTFFGSTAAYTLGITDSVVQNAGIVVPTGSATPVLLTVEYHGDLVQQPIYAVSNTAINICFVETLLQGE